MTPRSRVAGEILVRFIAYYVAEYGDATARLEEALSAQRALGVVSLTTGDYARAEAHQEEALACYRRLGDERGIAMALNSLGGALEQSDPERAERCYAESEATITRRRDRAASHADRVRLRLRRRVTWLWLALDPRTTLIPALALGPRTQQQVGWWRAYYHVVRPHLSLRRYGRSRTPAMAAGLTAHRWTAAEFLGYPCAEAG